MQSVLITGFLLLQVLIPLRYYLMGGGDDERFSWRMFSTTRLDRCKVRLYTVDTEAGTRRRRRVQDLREDLQAAWIHMLKRNRPLVVERYLARRCEGDGTAAPQEVEFVRDCRRADGVRRTRQRITMRCRDRAMIAIPGDKPR